MPGPKQRRALSQQSAGQFNTVKFRLKKRNAGLGGQIKTRQCGEKLEKLARKLGKLERHYMTHYRVINAPNIDTQSA